MMALADLYSHTTTFPLARVLHALLKEHGRRAVNRNGASRSLARIGRIHSTLDVL